MGIRCFKNRKLDGEAQNRRKTRTTSSSSKAIKSTNPFECLCTVFKSLSSTKYGWSIESIQFFRNQQKAKLHIVTKMCILKCITSLSQKKTTKLLMNKWRYPNTFQLYAVKHIQWIRSIPIFLCLGINILILDPPTVTNETHVSCLWWN